MIIEKSDWTRYRELAGVMEVDFHRAEQQDGGHYEDHMAAVYHDTLDALEQAQKNGHQYVLFTHRASTSYGWKKTTSRSVVRGIMRSPAATPYIIRAQSSIQHETRLNPRRK